MSRPIRTGGAEVIMNISWVVIANGARLGLEHTDWSTVRMTISFGMVIFIAIHAQK